MKLARTAFAWILLASLAAPAALALGCQGKVAGTMVAPEGADEDERAYQLGYRFGEGDRDHEIPASYSRHSRRYDTASERSFATGYRDGYSGVANRYHEPEAGAWYSDPGGSAADD